LEEYYRAGYHYCTNFSNALSGKWIGNPYTMRQGRADYEWFTNLGKDVQSANRVQIANNHMRLAAGFKQAVDEISALKSRAATAKTKIPHLERQLRQLDSEGKELQSKLLQLQAEKREIDLRKGNLKTGERMLEMIDLEIDRAILAIAKVFPPEALTGNDLNHKQAELSLPQPPANPYDNQNRQPVLKIFPEPPANPFKGEK
jgi:chromosome segregation ATPase